MHQQVYCSAAVCQLGRGSDDSIADLFALQEADIQHTGDPMDLSSLPFEVIAAILSHVPLQVSRLAGCWVRGCALVSCMGEAAPGCHTLY